jgi:hypothetical protein
MRRPLFTPRKVLGTIYQNMFRWCSNKQATEALYLRDSHKYISGKKGKAIVVLT